MTVADQAWPDCSECACLSASGLARRNADGSAMLAPRSGVLHALHISFDDDVPLCMSVSVSTRIRAGTMDPRELGPGHARKEKR